MFSWKKKRKHKELNGRCHLVMKVLRGKRNGKNTVHRIVSNLLSCVQLSKSSNICSVWFVKNVSKFLACRRSESDWEVTTSTQDVKRNNWLYLLRKILRNSRSEWNALSIDIHTYVWLFLKSFFYPKHIHEYMR